MDGTLVDWKHALRLLFRRPAFTAVAVVTLALGIGAATTMFTVLDAVVLRPLDYRAPEELVFLTESSPDGSQIYSVSLPNFRDWRERNRSFRALAAFRAASFNLTGRREPLRVRGAMVSANFFETLGVEPAMGVLPDGQRVVVSHRFWQSRLSGRSDVLGQSLTLDGRSFTIAGVMPEGFEFLTSTIDLWAPLEAFRDELPWNERGDHPALWVVGRLVPGVDLPSARADMERIGREIDEEHGHPHPPVLTSLQERSVGRARPALLALMGGVLLLLLIACANVANLLLARAIGRGREMATRSALGASRTRLMGQLWIESLLLAVAGGALGLLLATWGIDLVRALLPSSTPRLTSIRVEPEALAIGLALSIATSLLFGLAPLLEARPRKLSSSLRSSAGLVSAGRRFEGALVVLEVSLAVVLLLGTSLLVKSFLRLSSVDAGFRAESRVAARVALPPRTYDTVAKRVAFYHQLLDDVRARADVRAASVSTGLPLVSPGTEAGVAAENASGTSFDDDVLASIQLVSEDYFETMGVALLRGRVLDRRDTASSPRVAVVDESLANRLFGSDDPVGMRLSLGGTAENPRFAEIVGVVRHVLNYRLTSPQYVEVYLPLAQPTDWASDSLLEGNVIVWHEGSEQRALAAIREAVERVDPRQPIFGASTLDDVLSAELSPQKINGVLSASFAALALALAGIGLYGVLAGIVGRRRREIGLRMALGAQPREILGTVVRDGVVLTLLGIALGLVAATALSRVLASLLFDAHALDADVLATVVATTVVTAVIACLVPGRRAASVDPIEALRTE